MLGQAALQVAAESESGWNQVSASGVADESRSRSPADRTAASAVPRAGQVSVVTGGSLGLGLSHRIWSRKRGSDQLHGDGVVTRALLPLSYFQDLKRIAPRVRVTFAKANGTARALALELTAASAPRLAAELIECARVQGLPPIPEPEDGAYAAVPPSRAPWTKQGRTVP